MLANRICELYLGRNIRILPDLTRETFSPTPEFAFACYVYPTEGRLPFTLDRMKSERFTVLLLS